MKSNQILLLIQSILLILSKFFVFTLLLFLSALCDLGG